MYIKKTLEKVIISRCSFRLTRSFYFFSIFVRSLFAKRMKDTGALEEQRERGWKLFAKGPHNELSTKDSRKIQKVRSHTCTPQELSRSQNAMYLIFECFSCSRFTPKL